ncbi:MAG TPA: segregation/condensation protein A [Thermodesulfovibrionales bacterium]|jgi:segregation and condensation protein A|nr:segregation/condensation protein A [Thermodesulfovibrionales bacterium]
MEDIIKIKIPVFEGPFDLLLHLIREHKIDIYDIPISLITSQYLEYIEIMKELNLEIAGDFLVMAATLIQIKSRMLLPPDEEAPSEEQEDPRRELVQRLVEYQRYKEAALDFRTKEDEWLKVFHREPLSDEDEGELYLFDLSLFDLLDAFRKILDKAPSEMVSITKEILTVKNRMSMIMEIIEEHEAVRFEDLFKEGITKIHLIVTFLALLELIRLGLARAYQEREFGNIWVINPAKQSSTLTHQS